eukprot:CAMPEP_0202787654 /NCGR_PEP_ID=MMETSP1388-20130828/72966_1 /ASSEMBLY_ACC=CAM_ASM_000864 /TAXON_ID=37098 /ORGANISM="Isochrysis sp, Strain CCMP1244" /LENGTH=61 /DNA_ID=CAMNT_0049457255 /DNA_START=62 /DNA_END=244 /DNA_ORIENTATION=+
MHSISGRRGTAPASGSDCCGAGGDDSAEGRGVRAAGAVEAGEDCRGKSGVVAAAAAVGDVG